MINFVAGFLLGLSCLYSISIQWHELRRQLRELRVEFRAKDTETKPFVTRTNRAFTNENMTNQGSSIVTPKSPQLVEWEEQEELRKLNLKPR